MHPPGHRIRPEEPGVTGRLGESGKGALVDPFSTGEQAANGATDALAQDLDRALAQRPAAFKAS